MVGRSSLVVSSILAVSVSPLTSSADVSVEVLLLLLPLALPLKSLAVLLLDDLVAVGDDVPPLLLLLDDGLPVGVDDNTSEINTNLPKISTCALKNCKVTYGPDGMLNTFKNSKGMPTETTMELQFVELETLTSKRIREARKEGKGEF